MAIFAFQIPEGDSANLAFSPSDGPADLTGYALTFTAGTVVKTSGAGSVTVGTPKSSAVISVVAGDFPTAGTISASFVAVLGGTQLTWYGTVTVLDAAPTSNLTTLANVNRYLFGDTASRDSDAILSAFIASSSAWVVSRLGQEVLTRTVVETRDGNGGTRMLLRKSPVTSVTSVVVDGTTVTARASVGDTGFVLLDNAIDLVGYGFTSGTSNVVITYTAGAATVPADLEQACIEHVALRYRDRGRTGIASDSAGGESASYSNAGTLAFIEGVLDASPYKVWAVS